MSATSKPSPAIPLSPTSPPADGVKQRSKVHLPENAPHSPSSPPLMSVATKSYASSFANTQKSSGTAASQRSPSPPTSASTYTQDTHQPTMTSTNELPTPADSGMGLSRTATMDDQDQHQDKRQKMTPIRNADEDTMDVDEAGVPPKITQDFQSAPETRAQSDTSRQVSNEFPIANLAAAESHLASDDVSLEQLQKDMGNAFLLCKSTLSRSQPSPSQHLLALYGLSPLHATVARTDPKTGEKINKLRKSYEGQIKGFALAGRNKPVKVDIPEGGKGKLRNLVEDTPEDEQVARKSRAIEITPNFNMLLQKAMQMQPGTVRNHAHWEDALGHEKPRLLPVPEVTLKKPSTATAPVRQANGIVRSQGLVGGDPIRPRRMGKKRSYADDSFEGYGDGYVDDDGEMDQGAYSGSEDGGNGPGRKKRKKEHSFSTSPATYERPSFGTGGYVGSR